MRLAIAKAADVLLGGGVIAYPTEGVYGLGCLPDEPAAVLRILEIKRRDPSKGLILIASDKSQLQDWLDIDVSGIPDPDPRQAITWIAAAQQHVSRLVRGEHETLAVRLTTHPAAKALCDATDSPLVSTSANRAGQPTARNRHVLRRHFGACVDYVVPGDCGPSTGPSEIRDLSTGSVIRPRTS